MRDYELNLPEKRPIQIDPYDCGCTECIIGLYVPLQEATYKQLLKMFAGKLMDATSNEFMFADGWIYSRWHGLGWHQDGMKARELLPQRGW